MKEMLELADELHAFVAAAPHEYPGHLTSLFERAEAALRASAVAEPVAWRYKCHDGRFVLMTDRLADEQKARGYYRDEDDIEAEDDDNNDGPFFWCEEAPLYAHPEPLQKVIDEMIAVAAHEDDGNLPEWTSENRAIIDRWQVCLSDHHLRTAGSPAAPVPASVREAEGWRLVPLEPTLQQHIAAMEFALAHMALYGVTSLSPFSDYPPLRETTAGMYRSMVSAAPSISSLPAPAAAPTKPAAPDLFEVVKRLADGERSDDGHTALRLAALAALRVAKQGAASAPAAALTREEIIEAIGPHLSIPSDAMDVAGAILTLKSAPHQRQGE